MITLPVLKHAHLICFNPEEAKLGYEDESDLTLIKHLGVLESQSIDDTALIRLLNHYNGI